VRLTAKKRRTRTHTHVRTFEGEKLPVVHGLYFPEIALTGHPVAQNYFLGYFFYFSWECDWGSGLTALAPEKLTRLSPQGYTQGYGVTAGVSLVVRTGVFVPSGGKRGGIVGGMRIYTPSCPSTVQRQA
jgi:hypothetical protein